MKLLQKSRIQVNTDLNLLVHILEWFDRFYLPVVPQAVWLECQLALAEGFTNAVRHAHRDRPSETAIDLELQIHSQAIEMRIWDQGEAFDLAAHLQALPSQIRLEAEGGRGLKLMQQTMTTLQYLRSSDDRNCLVMIKHYDAIG